MDGHTWTLALVLGGVASGLAWRFLGRPRAWSCGAHCPLCLEPGRHPHQPPHHHATGTRQPPL